MLDLKARIKQIMRPETFTILHIALIKLVTVQFQEQQQGVEIRPRNWQEMQYLFEDFCVV